MEYLPTLRSLSIYDCGVSLNVEALRMLTGLTAYSLKYLTFFGRTLGDTSKHLPSSETFITDDAAEFLVQYLKQNPDLTVFTKHSMRDERELLDKRMESSLRLLYNDKDAKLQYDCLVSRGHIAAFRMYDSMQLLALDYFKED